MISGDDLKRRIRNGLAQLAWMGLGMLLVTSVAVGLDVLGLIDLNGAQTRAVTVLAALGSVVVLTWRQEIRVTRDRSVHKNGAGPSDH